MLRNDIIFKPIWLLVPIVLLSLVVLRTWVCKDCLDDLYHSFFDEDIDKVHAFHGTISADAPFFLVPSIHEEFFTFVCDDDLQPGSGIKTYKQLTDYYQRIRSELIPPEVLAKFPQLKASEISHSAMGRYDCWFSRKEGPDNLCGRWIIQDRGIRAYYVLYRHYPYPFGPSDIWQILSGLHATR